MRIERLQRYMRNIEREILVSRGDKTVAVSRTSGKTPGPMLGVYVSYHVKAKQRLWPLKKSRKRSTFCTLFFRTLNYMLTSKRVWTIETFLFLAFGWFLFACRGLLIAYFSFHFSPLFLDADHSFPLKSDQVEYGYGRSHVVNVKWYGRFPKTVFEYLPACMTLQPWVDSLSFWKINRTTH